MTDPSAPPVPELTNQWIATRGARLLEEISAPHRQRPYTRLAVGGVGAACVIAAAIFALVLTLAGPGAQSAFADWSATPTPPASGQVAAAEAVCAGSGLRGPDNSAEGTPERGGPERGASSHALPQAPHIAPSEWQTELTDTRGPFTMVILEAEEGHAIGSCLVGPPNPAGGAPWMVNGNASFTQRQSQPIPAGQVQVWYENVERLPQPPYTYTKPGALYTRIEGHTGASVTGVTVVLEDGTHVQASTANGWFLAWWPGSQQAASAEITTNSGVSTQQLSREGS